MALVLKRFPVGSVLIGARLAEMPDGFLYFA